MQLYQTYRPRKLSEIVGHDTVKKELYKRFKNNTLPQTIVFTSQTGTGKTSFSRILSTMIQCKAPDKNGDACLECEQCLDVINENFCLGVQELNASNLNTEDMRDIEMKSQMKSLLSPKKIFIINEWQEIWANAKARKNLLSVLENVNKHSHIIITAMDGTKIDAAVKDRATSYNLKSLDFEIIAKHLYDVCEKESVKIDTEEKTQVLITIAENSNGSMRRALSYLERCIQSELWKLETLFNDLDIVSIKDLSNIINKLLLKAPESLNFEYTEETIKTIKFLLVLLWKKQKKLTLNGWEFKQISALSNFSSETISELLKCLNSLYNFAYFSKEIMNSILIEYLENDRKEVTETDSSVKRRKKD